jgi:hypothetical protein
MKPSFNLWEFASLERIADFLVADAYSASVAAGASAEIFSVQIPTGKIGFLEYVLLATSAGASTVRVFLGDRELISNSPFGALTLSAQGYFLYPIYSGVALRGTVENNAAIPDIYHYGYQIFLAPDVDELRKYLKEK